MDFEKAKYFFSSTFEKYHVNKYKKMMIFLLKMNE